MVRVVKPTYPESNLQMDNPGDPCSRDMFLARKQDMLLYKKQAKMCALAESKPAYEKIMNIQYKTGE